MKILKTKIDPEGYVNLWGPFLAALAVFLLLLFFFATMTTDQVVKQIETKVNKKFDQLQQPPVYVPKLDSATQEKLNHIETNREIAHMRVNNMHDGEVQGLLDSLFNTR